MRGCLAVDRRNTHAKEYTAVGREHRHIASLQLMIGLRLTLEKIRVERAASFLSILIRLLENLETRQSLNLANQFIKLPILTPAFKETMWP
jgi:molybdopterin/thiamine biosynthesis adenylyltransferase